MPEWQMTPAQSSGSDQPAGRQPRHRWASWVLVFVSLAFLSPLLVWLMRPRSSNIPSAPSSPVTTDATTPSIPTLPFDVPITLLRTLTGHTQEVHAVAFAPNGKWVASGGGDSTIRLWDVQRGAVHKTLTGHSGTVWAVSFSPDGKTLASGGADGTARLWDLRTGEILHSLLKLDLGFGVYAVAFSPDGQIVALGGNRIVYLSDPQTGTVKRKLAGHDSVVQSVAFSPDGETVASASRDKTVRMWDVQTGAMRGTLTGHRSSVYSVAFAPNRKMLATGGQDDTVRIWGDVTALPESVKTEQVEQTPPVKGSPKPQSRPNRRSDGRPR